jgi:hypothetical protein
VPITVGQIKKLKGAGIATMADLAGASGRSVPKLGGASNSQKAVVNLLIACGKAVTDAGGVLQGVKACGEKEGPFLPITRRFVISRASRRLARRTRAAS